MNIDGRSVFGYFTDRNDAEQAMEQLVSAGFDKSDLGLDSIRDSGAVGTPSRPISGSIGSLSELTLGTPHIGDDTGILLSADPSASGLASQSDGVIPEKAWVLVAVTDGSDEEVERAVKILKRHGADV